MSNSPFLDGIIPAPAPADDRYIWAKVTQTSPLRIQVDGDRFPLAITPDDLGANNNRPVDQRVYCQIINRRLVVLGPVVIPAAVDPTPPGTVHEFAGSVLPAGYLWADGAAVSRTTYAALYAALGGVSSPWGQGDGSTTFNVPNKKGRVGVGRDATQAEFDTLGETGGGKTHTHSIAHTHSTPAHSHSLSAAGYALARIVSSSVNFAARIITTPSWTTTTVLSGTSPATLTTGLTQGIELGGATDSGGAGTTGAASAADTGSASSLPPYLVSNYIIKT